MKKEPSEFIELKAEHDNLCEICAKRDECKFKGDGFVSHVILCGCFESQGDETCANSDTP